MKILAMEIETPGATTEQFKPFLQAEAQRAWELYQSGIIRELYFRDDRPEAVLVLECPDVTAAQEILNSLPLVREGLIRFDLVPLRPYPGFGRLFNADIEKSANP